MRKNPWVFLLMTSAMTIFADPLVRGISRNPLTTSSDEFAIPIMTKPPLINGKIEPAEWRDAVEISGAPTLETRKVSFRVGWTPEKLYLAARCEMPPGGELVSDQRPWLSDSLEFWFAPPETGRTVELLKFGFFQMILAHDGRFYFRHHEPGYGQPASEWRPEFTEKHRKQDGWWESEIAIDAKSFGFDQIRPGDWRILLVRTFQSKPEGQVRYNLGGSFNDPKNYIVFHLREKTPVVSNAYSPGGGRLPALYTVYDLSDGQTCGMAYEVNGVRGTEKMREGKIVDLSGKIPAAESILKVRIVAPDGSVIFQRDTMYAPPPERIWFNMESYINFRHTFADGLKKPDRSVTPLKSVQVRGEAEIPLVPGHRDNDRAAHFSSGQAVLFNGVKLPIPGAVSLWIKPVTALKERARIRFLTLNSPELYFFYQENQAGHQHAHIGMGHHRSKEGRIDMGIAKVLPWNEWSNLLVNFEKDRFEIYVNGTKIGERGHRFGNLENGFNSLMLGESGSVGDFLVGGLTIYGRALTPGEVKKSVQSNSLPLGKLLWYPSRNAVAVDLSCDLKTLQGVKELELSVLNADRRKELCTRFPLKGNPVISEDGADITLIHRVFPLEKPLPEGTYLIRLALPGSKNPLMEKSFLAKKYPWTGNKLGTAPRVIPPFTPVSAEGRTLSAVLRDYRIAPNGLPEQIVSQGRELLAGPVELFLEKNGRVETLKNGRFRIVSRTDFSLKYEAESSSSSVTARIAGTFEIDGLLRLDIDLWKIGDAAPDRIWLDIPVKKEIAKLYHAVGEGIRANPAGFLPAGNGTIFKSRSIPQIRITNFLAYLWVGDDTRGVCYAADWDKGWIHSEKRDATELIRSTDGMVHIRLNLLNTPFREKQNPTLTLGLMASPVKPMPEGWRGWIDGYPDFVANRTSRCLYSSKYWGSYLDCASRYPFMEDFTYFRKLTETMKTGKIDYEFIRNWIERVKNAPPVWTPTLQSTGLQSAVNHTNVAFAEMKKLYGKNHPFYYIYTCCFYPTRLLPENEVYGDEWAEMNVGGSYGNYAIYYLNKMLNAGMGGLYNDNTYLVANYDWVVGNAWIDNRGTVHPSLGVWRMREFLRRQLTLQAEHGLEPWITVHQTNGNVLPALGFATNSMGMEWKYGLTDYQDRFSPDYIRTVNQGLQGGFYPTVLDGIPPEGTKEQRRRCTRTMLAALLPHEVRPTAERASDHVTYKKIHDILFQFGIWRKDCAVYPCWDEKNPVQCLNPELLVTAYRRGRQLLLVCGNSAGDLTADITCPETILSAADAETGKPLEFHGRKLVLPVAKHDLALVILDLK